MITTATAELTCQHEDAESIPWSQAPASARLEQLGRIFVDRDVTQIVFDVIEAARADRQIYPEAKNVVIVGETGVGKSEIAKRYLAANLERVDPETGNIVRPVLYVDVRDSSTPRTLARAMLRRLMRRNGLDNDADWADSTDEAAIAAKQVEDEDKRQFVEGAAAELTYQLKKQMVGQKVEVVILDEFHNTLKDDGEGTLNRVANWTRDFAKTKERTARAPDGTVAENIVIVMMGTHKVRNIVDPTRHPELCSISPYRVEIPRYRYRTIDEKKEFRQFLDDLDTVLPFDADSNLGSAVLADKIHIATFGLLRQVGQIIGKAGELAIADGSDHIHEHHLHRAVVLLPGVLEAAMLSEESTKAEKALATNPFTPPLLPDKPVERRRSTYRPS